MSCLVLNASMEPMAKPLSYKAATRLVLQGKAEIVECEPEELRSEKLTVPKPTVIRLLKMVKVPQNFRKGVTNTFLFARDQYTCQYCGRHESQLTAREELNRDHVLPQSRGGKNTWDNCVTSCTTCNSKKADRTPSEAGMKLRKVPTEPRMVGLRWQIRKLTPMQRKYVELFYGEDFLKFENRGT